ncbi:MAG TPA: acyltransferase family protein [Gaiellaceae bacterium]|nr:acyltransferase family protein [Gaiellaceae bacterium]
MNEHLKEAPIRGSTPRSGDDFRPDIQGLRGIAVLIVALSHAGVAGMNGGYVGVDVFFVISGFLITGWLLGRALESGRVPFGDFYASRARRILPAAVLTLTVTCAASVAFLNPVRAASALHDAVWAAFFSANVHFAGVGTDYFAQDDPPSPIQHFWTLAVEEQFYVVWPLLLAAVLLAQRSRRRGGGASRGALAGVVALGVGASLAWSIYSTGTNPSGAYFSAPARAWELGVGALIAVGLPWILQAPAGLRAALTWVGLAGIVIATVTFGSGTPFPGFAALLPVAAAGLVIAGGAGQAHRAGAAIVLGRQPLRLVGDLSYAFYLWHWPMLVIAAQYAGHPLSTLQNVALLAAAFVVSYVTYKLYENPLRHCRSLRRPRLALVLWPASLAAVALAVALGTSSLVTPSAAAPSLDVHSVVERAGQRSDAKPRTVRQALLEGVSPARLRQPVPRALAPPLGQLLDDRYRLGACAAGTDEASASVCEFGDTRARRRMIVLGDSHAAMWMPALIQFARRYHWRLVPLIKTGCVPAATGSGSCAAWYRWALGHVRRLHPRAVVLSQTWWSGSAQEGIDAVSRELQDLAQLTPRLAIIEDPPGSGRATLDCLLARHATLGSCAFRVTPDQAAIYSSVRRAARAAHAAYVPTLRWFCVQGLCPAVVGTIVTYRDPTHITATYARQLARPFGATLATATP